MKLPLICSKCMQENTGEARPIAVVEFRDDGRYQFTCPKGHTSVTLLQEQKFEILFEIGAYAIADGYYREAVSSFAASLERCYEFFVRALLFENKVDPSVVEQSWKAVAAQSERQLGAFVFLYTLQFRRKPPLLSSARVSFRNDVIHRGRIPTRAEAIEYGQEVLDVVREIINDAQEHLPAGVQQTVFQHMSETRAIDDGTRPVATLSIGTIIRLATRDSSHHSRSLEEAVSSLRRWDASQL